MSDKHPSSENKEASPGQYLRTLRLEKDISIEDVADETKISIKNIRAIEQSIFEQLPADTFVRGLVTLYGNFLGIDGGKIAADFLAERKKHATGSRPQSLTMKTIPPSTLAPKKLAEPSHISSATVALILLATIILSFTAFCLYTSWNPFAFLSKQTNDIQVSIQKMLGSDQVQKSTRDDGQISPSAGDSQETIQENTQLSTATEQADYPYRFTAHFIRNCTVTVSIDGGTPIKKRYVSGQVAHWKAKQQLKISFDTPKAATLTLNNAPLSFPVPENDQPPSLLLPDDILDQQ